MSSEVDPKEGAMSFFSENVDRWGAAEWFDRLAKAIGAQNKAVVDGDDVGFETYRMIASSSAMRLVSDYEAEVRRALSALVYHEEPAGDTQGAAKLVAWRAITVAGNVLYFAANDKPVEPSWEIIPLYAAPAALVSPPDNGELGNG